MAWACSGSTNAELIDNLFKNGLITDPKVRDAMVNVDRAKFCPDRTHAYQDSPQSIGHLATISAPHMHASACEALLPYLKPGNTVLDVGSGSGYLTAVLAELVVAPEGQLPGGTGKVIGLEHIAALRDLGQGNMVKSRRGKELLASGKVKFVVGDGRKGYVNEEIYGGRDEELWDAIHVGAAAIEVHEELIKQLKRPGRMFIPVENGKGGDQWIWLIDKDENGDVKRTRREAVRYVLLTDAPK